MPDPAPLGVSVRAKPVRAPPVRWIVGAGLVALVVRIPGWPVVQFGLAADLVLVLSLTALLAVCV